MDLKKATLFVIIGISCKFVLRIFGTLFPGFFRIFFVVQADQIVSLLAGLAMVFFFVSFYKDCVQKGEAKLQEASVFAIIGSSAGVLATIKGLFLVFQRYLSPYLVRYLVTSHSIETILPWVSTLCILYFFVIFYREALHKKWMELKTPAFLAVVGSFIGVLLSTFVAYHYFRSGEVRWFSEIFRRIPIVFILLAGFVFITLFYFFLSFYKEQQE